MKVVTVQTFNEFKIQCLGLFSNPSFINSIPSNADSYTINMFDSKPELIEQIRKSAKFGGSYILLSGDLETYATAEDTCVLFIEGISDKLKTIKIGGCY